MKYVELSTNINYIPSTLLNIFLNTKYMFNYVHIFVMYQFLNDQITWENTTDFFLAESVVEFLAYRMIWRLECVHQSTLKASTQCSRYYESKTQIMNKHNCSPSMSLLPADKAAGRGDQHVDSHSVWAPSHTTQADTKQFSTKVDKTAGRSGHGMYFYTLTYTHHSWQ